MSIKCVVIGDGSVGKTCLMINYTTNKCSNSITIPMNINIVDDMGQEMWDIPHGIPEKTKSDNAIIYVEPKCYYTEPKRNKKHKNKYNCVKRRNIKQPRNNNN